MFPLLVITLLILLISRTNGYSIRSSSSINRIVKKSSVIRTCTTNDLILNNDNDNNSNNDNTVTTTSTTSTTTTANITNDDNDKKKGFIDPEVYIFLLLPFIIITITQIQKREFIVNILNVAVIGYFLGVIAEISWKVLKAKRSGLL